MGRANRPSSNKTGFDPLRELKEEGLPSGWEAYWQGERGEISEVSEPAAETVDTEILAVFPLEQGEGTLLDVGPMLVQEKDGEQTYFHGKIQVVHRDAGKRFEAVITTSPMRGKTRVDLASTVYQGESLEEAARAINEETQKQLADGYKILNKGDDPLFLADGARTTARNIIQSEHRKMLGINE